MSTRIRSFASIALALAALTGAGSALAHGQGHASLTPDQRAKLEASMQAERAARTELRKALAAQVERGQIDRAALGPQIAAETQAEANLKAARESVLTADQKAQIAKRKEEHKANKEAGEKREHHFKGAARLDLSPQQKEQIKARMAAEPKTDQAALRMINRFDAMVPVLTPAQRAELAKDLRK